MTWAGRRVLLSLLPPECVCPPPPCPCPANTGVGVWGGGGGGRSTNRPTTRRLGLGLGVFARKGCSLDTGVGVQRRVDNRKIALGGGNGGHERRSHGAPQLHRDHECCF